MSLKIYLPLPLIANYLIYVSFILLSLLFSLHRGELLEVTPKLRCDSIYRKALDNLLALGVVLLLRGEAKGCEESLVEAILVVVALDDGAKSTK
jgi:hypothetical protein